MKNTLFTGIAGENLSGIAHHLGRGGQNPRFARSGAGPWVWGGLFWIKTVARNIIVAPCAVLRCYRFTTLS